MAKRKETKNHLKAFASSLCLCFLVAEATLLVLRFVFHKHFHPNRSVFPFGSSIIRTNETQDWELLEHRDEGLRVHRQYLPHSKIYAYKSDVVADIPIKRVLETFYDTTRCKEWVKDLFDVQELPCKAKHGKCHARESIVIHQYKLTHVIPGVKNRQFVSKRYAIHDWRKRSETVVLQSLTSDEGEDDYPLCRGCIRGFINSTEWVFTDLPGDKTLIELSSVVDPLGSLSPRLTNFYQKGWAGDTISGLIEVSRSRTDNQTFVWDEIVLADVIADE